MKYIKKTEKTGLFTETEGDFKVPLKNYKVKNE